jgi:hypothetical protein
MFLSWAKFKYMGEKPDLLESVFYHFIPSRIHMPG